MRKLLLKNGRVVDPKTKTNKILDVLIVGGKIKRIGKNISDKDAQIINARGKIIAPGLIDAHVHLREPGFEYKETIQSGSRAAAAGGFTTILMEPNTLPPVDTPARVTKIRDIAKRTGIVNVYTKACLSKGLRGERLTDIRALIKAGAVAVSDDGNPVGSKKLMSNAFKESKKAKVVVSPHCEESPYYRNLLKSKLEKNKQTCSLIGAERFADMPYWSEADFIKRDIELSEATGAKLHVSHVSLAESVEAIALAKKRGVKITAEAAPHHLLLTETDAKKIGTNAKVNPPLRTKKDVDALIKGLADGTIDIIASDHAPHALKEKKRKWDKAPFGLIGLETTLGLVLTYLVKPGVMSMSQAIEKMSFLPAKIFGLKTGSLTIGSQADLTIIDPGIKWKIDAARFYSKGKNSPFNGWNVQGRAAMTIVKGRVVMKDGKIVID